MEGLIILMIIMGICLMFGGKSVGNSSSTSSHDKSPEDKSGDDDDLGSSLYTYMPSRTSNLQIPQFRLYEQTDQQVEAEKARLEKWQQEQGERAVKDIMRRFHPCENRSCDYCPCNDPSSLNGKSLDCQESWKRSFWAKTPEGQEILARKKEWRDDERAARMRELDSRARDIEMDLMRIRIKSNPFLRGK